MKYLAVVFDRGNEKEPLPPHEQKVAYIFVGEARLSTLSAEWKIDPSNLGRADFPSFVIDRDEPIPEKEDLGAVWDREGKEAIMTFGMPLPGLVPEHGYRLEYWPMTESGFIETTENLGVK